MRAKIVTITKTRAIAHRIKSLNLMVAVKF